MRHACVTHLLHSLPTLRRLAGLLCLVAAVGLLLLAPQAAGGELFMTSIEKKVGEDRNKKKFDYFAPTNTKIAYAWSDRGFAVHIPFKAETEYDVRRYYDGTVEEGYRAKEYIVEVWVTGLSYLYPQKGKRYAGLGRENAGTYWAGGGWNDNVSRGKKYYLGMMPNREEKADRTPAQISQRNSMKKPGTLTVWVALVPYRGDFGRPAWDHWGESVTGTFHVVVRRKKTREQPEKVVLESELPFKIRQNAWVIRKAHEKKEGDWGKVAGKWGDRAWTLEDHGVQLQGSTLVSRHRRLGSPTKSGVAAARTDYEVRYTFPTRLFDHKGSELTIRAAQLRGFPGRYSHMMLSRIGWTVLPWPAPDGDRIPERMRTTVNGIFGVEGRIPTADRDLAADPNTKLRYRESTFPLPFKFKEWRDARQLRAYTMRTQPRSGGYDPRLVDLRLVGSHRLIEIREEYRFSGGGRQKPTRLIEIEAMRLSEIEDNRRGNITDPRTAGPDPEPPDDGYYPWINRFSEKRLKVARDLQVAHATLSALNAQWKDKRRQALKLLRLFCQGQLSDDADGEEMWLVVRRHLEGTSPPLAGKMSNKQLEKLRARRVVLAGELADIRTEQRDTITRVTVGLEELASSAREQAKRSGLRRRPYVRASARFWTSKAAMERVKLYESAGLNREMRQAIEELKLDAKHMDTFSPETKYFAHLMEGKARKAEAEEADERVQIQLAQGREVGEALAMLPQRLRMLALYEFRKAQKLKPDDKSVAANIQKLELVFLYLIQAKVEREKKVTWEAFEHYLRERGFDINEPKTLPSAAWEYWMTFWGSGPIGAVYWIYDKAGARADRAIAVQETAARDLVALRAIRRLRASGLMLEQIRGLSSMDLREVLRGPEGNQLGERSARVLALDIQTAFSGSLPELVALTDGTEDQFRKQLVTPHFSMDFESTTPESVADFFNAVNIGAFFLGGTICKVNGKWGGGIIKPKGLLGMNLQPGAKVTRFRDLVLTSFRNSRLGAALKKPGLVKWLANRISTGNEGLNKLYVIRYFAKGGRLLGVIALLGGIHVLADEYNVPALAIFVDALACLGAGEMLGAVLDDIALPPARALKKVIGYKKILELQKAELGVRVKDLEEVTRILEQRQAAAALPAGSPRKNLTDMQKRALDKIRQKYNIDPNDAIPGLNPSLEIDMALAETCNSIQNGHVKQAARSASAAKSALKTPKMNIDENLIQVQHSIDALEQQIKSRAKRSVSRPYKKELTAIEDPLPDPWMPAAGYPDHPCGALWQEADEWFARGDLDIALNKLQQARHLAVKSGPKGYVKMLDRRLGLVVTVRNAAKYLAETRKVLNPLNVGKYIGGDELASIQRRIDAGELKVVLQKSQGTNALYELHADGKPVYVFKILTKGSDEAKATELANEELGAMLFNVPGLGTRAPAARKTHLQFNFVRLDGGQGGAAKGLGVLMRHLPGKEMLAQRESMVYALKSEYAKMRVLTLLLGDADRHLRNCLLAGDHFLHALDFGNCHLWKKGTRRFRMGLKGEVFQDERALMEYCANFAEEVQRVTLEGGGKLKNREMYNWMKQIEDVIDYDVDMKPTVDALRKWVKKDNGRELREMLEIAFQKIDSNGKRILDANGKPVVDRQRAQEAFEVVNERVDLLEPILRKRFPRWELRKPALHGRPPATGGGEDQGCAPRLPARRRRAA